MAELTSRAAVVWRYLPGRKYKHALRITEGSATGHAPYALCGTAPGWFVPDDSRWHGTGSQNEYEAVERAIECGRCTRLLTPKETGNDDRRWP